MRNITIERMVRARMSTHTATLSTMIERMRARETAARHMATLLAEASGGAKPLYNRSRSASGIVAVAWRHHALTPVQLRVLAGFRLRQFVLCGFYDPQMVAAHELDLDPELRRLPSDTIHVCVGDARGRLLAYVYLRPPAEQVSGQSAGACLETPNRPLFPCEYESFGPHVFASLPALRGIAIRHMTEISMLLRNQVVAEPPMSVQAVAEALHAAMRLLMAPAVGVQGMLGCMNERARRFVAFLGLPLLYAPQAPVIYDRLAPYWSSDANAAGRFWPFVVATADLVAGEEHLDRLDDILALPAAAVGRQLARLRAQSVIAPSAFVPAPGASPQLWTDDGGYEQGWQCAA
jgi:hypothetical protein